jgi:hypothetical protein
MERNRRCEIMRNRMFIIVFLFVLPAALPVPAGLAADKTGGDETPQVTQGRRWAISTVHATGDVGRHAAVALQPGSGKTFIPYGSSGNWYLAFTTQYTGNCSTPHWYCELKDAFNGAAMSSHFPFSDTWGVAYQDNNELRLWWSNTSCSTGLRSKSRA